MIAPPPNQRLPDHPMMRRAHTVAIEEEQRRLPKRIERLIQSQPEIAIATAVALGMVVGWFVKRRNW